MDNRHNHDDKYEQEFIDNVRKTTPPTTSKASVKSNNKNNIPIIVAVILACVVIIESIALAVLIIKNSSSDETEIAVESLDDSPEAMSNGGNLTFDDNYTITALNYTCTAEDGAKYTFDKSNHYQKTDTSSNIVSEGDYSIVNGGAIVLSNSDAAKEDAVVYFDGYYIMEGLTFYNCGEE